MKNFIFKLLGLYVCDHCGIVFSGKVWKAVTYNPSNSNLVDLCQRCGDPHFDNSVIEDRPKRRCPPAPPYISTRLGE